MLCSFTLLHMWPLLSEFTAGCSLDLSKPNPGLYKGSSTSCALYRSNLIHISAVVVVILMRASF